MAKLDAELKALSKRLEVVSRQLEDSKASQVNLTKELGQAQKLEDTARTALKHSTQKVQYTAAIRELDERERQKAAIVKPLKDSELRVHALEKEYLELTTQQQLAREQFEEFHRIFLAEHENQVVARDQARMRKLELESKLEPVELGRFNRLILGRHGQAVVCVENGACTGCRTKLRGPLLAQLREKHFLNCESCQRILFLPQNS
jgi:predicted  nucleic acid-binding Zn-ribbon protein